MIKAIDTLYKGYSFRSRLEARWAVFFDALKVKWEYEKEGYDLGDDGGKYLPDFWIPMCSEWNFEGWPDPGFWYEIKGTTPSEIEMKKAVGLARLTKHTTRILVGPPGMTPTFYAHHSGNWGEELATEMHGGDEIDQVFHLQAVFHQVLPDGTSLQDMARAIVAARSARFEHGENGQSPVYSHAQYRGRKSFSLAGKL